MQLSTYWRAARQGERRVRTAWGQATTYYQCFGPDAVHHACCSGWCCNRHLKLSVLSATTTMYSLQRRDRQTEKDVLRMSRLVQSLVLCVLTHTPLHSTSTPAILSGCDPTDWSCMLAWQAGRMVGPPITIISDHANIVIEK